MILLRSILKSHVSATSYVNEHGTAVNRREHEDSRTSALEGLRSHPDHRVRSYARKILGSKDSYDLHQIRRDRFGHLPHWNKLDEHTRHAIVDAEEEKAKGHKEFEDWQEKHGSKKGKKKDSEKVDRSGWEQQLMFKARRVQHIAYILRKSWQRRGYSYTSPVHGKIVVVPPSPIHRQHTAIAEKHIRAFITEEPKLTIGDGRHKSKYITHGDLENGDIDPRDVDTLAEYSAKFIEEYSKHNHHNPLVAKYGHHVVFYPNKESMKRLKNYRKAYIEYALHLFASKPSDGDHRIRKTDKDKIENYDNIKEILLNADGVIPDTNNPNKINYWKEVRTGKKKDGILVLEMELNEEGDSVPTRFRFVTHLPTRKVPRNNTPSANPGTEGLVSAQTAGTASQVVLNNLSLPENKFNKSRNPLHLIRRRGC